MGDSALRARCLVVKQVMSARELGLAGMAANRRGVRYGFPTAQAGLAVKLISETGRRLDGVKERVLRYRFQGRKC